jgi:P4 family phage/plasmid primase-like protien
MTPTETRLAILARGFRPVPIVTGRKFPGINDWQILCASSSAEDIATWPDRIRGHDGTGILCGEVIGLDIDIHDPARADAAECRAYEAFGFTPFRRTGAKGMLLIYRVDRGVIDWRGTEQFIMPDLAPEKREQVEIRGSSQQFVAFGTHPETGQPYKWHGATPADTHVSEAPAVTVEQLQDYLAGEAEALKAAGGQAVERASSQTRLATSIKDAASLAPPDAASPVALLEAMPNPLGFDRHSYVGVMLAAKGCIDGLEAAGRLNEGDAEAIRDAAVDWAERWEGYRGDNEEEKWESDWSTRDRNLAGWGSLLSHADRLGVDVSRYRLADAQREFPALPDEAPAAEPEVTLLEMTEDAAALAFAARYAGRFVFDHTDGKWFAFDPAVGWNKDQTRGISRAVRGFIRDARQQWGEEGSKAAAKIAFSTAVERACQSDAHMAVTRDIWDADPFVLGIPGGHVDLRTGATHPADPRAYVLRRAGVAPASGSHAPLWGRFLAEATGGDAQLERWLQRLAGYALTGDVSEEVLPFLYGPGGNGKGVFLHTLSAILGDYAYQAPADLFKADSRVNPEYHRAKLDGPRVVMASETEANTPLAESLVKEITGNEGKLNGRNPFGQVFEFRSKAKLLIVGNHAPRLRGKSAAMERRLRVVPFDKQPARRDLQLKDKLAAEYPAILRWAIEGCLAWQREGLGTCDAVAGASASYFEGQDAISEWLGERCYVGSGHKARSSELLGDHNAWLRGRGEPAVSAQEFKEALGQRPAIAYTRDKTGSTYRGVSLRTPDLRLADLGDGQQLALVKH